MQFKYHTNSNFSKKSQLSTLTVKCGFCKLMVTGIRHIKKKCLEIGKQTQAIYIYICLLGKESVFKIHYLLIAIFGSSFVSSSSLSTYSRLINTEQNMCRRIKVKAFTWVHGKWSVNCSQFHTYYTKKPHNFDTLYGKYS